MPTTLHTPLMSGTNAIHGIVLVGAPVVAGRRRTGPVADPARLIAIVFAAMNMVGGFVVTDRMLEMFKKPKPQSRRDAKDERGK